MSQTSETLRALRRLLDFSKTKEKDGVAPDSLGVNRPDVRQGRCAGNAHHFINSSEGVSAGLFWVCGAGGELLDGRGLPDDLQTLIAQMLNAARL